MKRSLLFLGLAGLLLSAFTLFPSPSTEATAKPEATSLTWHTSWEKAAAESKKTGKPILMDFTGSDWCGWCIKLKKEVFNTPTFSSWANSKVVLLELDFPRSKQLDAATKKQNDRLAKKYNVQGFPTIVFADHTGKVISTYGYDAGGPANWTRKAEAGWKKS